MRQPNPRPAAPLTCYVMQGEHPLPYPVIEKFASGQGEIAKDVFLLSACLSPFLGCMGSPRPAGKSGIVTTPHGLRIACLGGAYDTQVYAESESPHVSSSGISTVFIRR